MFFDLNCNPNRTKKIKIMKKKLLIFISAFATINSFAQMSIPNGNFESWTSSTYDFPQYYPNNSNPQTFFQYSLPYNLTQSTDAYSGAYAFQMTTLSNGTDTAFAYMTNADNTASGGGPSAWTGGSPITQKPNGVRGWYKYAGAGMDSALIIVMARQGGSTIGMYTFTLGNSASYSLFNFNFSPALTVIPDSIIFAASSSNALATSGVPGSVLKMDSVSFTGITVQPTLLNGDFEIWQNQTFETPNNWYNSSSNVSSVQKTTDNAAGNFAAELQTTLGDRGGVPAANSATLSNGVWNNMCSCYTGGYPFNNQVDTLVLSYKYTPADPTDTAFINLMFKASGAGVGFVGAYLPAAAAYTTMQIPINCMSTPDTAIITFQSSLWQDSTLNYIGAVLKIDEMHFKTQPLTTGISSRLNNKEVSFYPNPFRTTGTISIDPVINTFGMEVILYNALGVEVKKIQTNEHKILIDRNNLENGVYFYEIRTKDGNIKKGKIVME